jgi:hypothetical protein
MLSLGANDVAYWIRRLTPQEMELIGDRGITVDASGDLWAHDEAEDKALVDELVRDFRKALKPPPRPPKH